MQESPKLFYLGRKEDGTDVLYKNKDLTTHALIIGMTGSGKTGLGVGLLEEAALDNIPSIIIDPKGDMGNLLLAFPNLSKEEFLPWIDPQEADNKNQSAEEAAFETAQNWQNGLKEWGEDKDRVAAFKNSAHFTIYTPAASFGVGVNILSSFKAPPQEILDDTDTLNALISSSATGILSLVGINADPLSSKEHILISSIFTHFYKSGKDVSLENLISSIVTPPFDKVGVFSLETFFPKDKRMEFAMKINAIIASPSFASWLEGEDMDIDNFLSAKDGKPRICIFNIAHLNDNERMFFVTLLLNSILTWMRRQEGTLSLKALLYMDEIFGFFPPNANPPSKIPMLTLLKQARAFGLGVVLSTQNPIDLDYKGLSNIGTWFIGRLQTAQDKERVISGLSGIQGSDLNKAELTELLSNLKKRHFLLKNINEEGLNIFQTRWTLSYLKGPLSREQIRFLMQTSSVGPIINPAQMFAPSQTTLETTQVSPKISKPPKFISTLPQYYFYEHQRDAYRLSPYLVCTAKARFVSTRKEIDEETNVQAAALILPDTPVIWKIKEYIGEDKLEKYSREGSEFDDIASFIDDSKKINALQKDALDFIARTQKLTLFSALDIQSKPKESKEEFNIRVEAALEKAYEQKYEELKEKYDKIQKGLDDKFSRLRLKLEKEKSEAQSKTIDTIASIGTSILGAFLGKSKLSSVSKTASGVKNANKMFKERADVQRAEQEIAAVEEEAKAKENEFQAQIKKLKDEFSLEKTPIEEVVITLRKTDVYNEKIFILWQEA
ncbi:MAG: DUF87 domain-containing protein [Campylobacteraceae bacterium]|jgi:hypothetical protein|nr:DUF87 domain-containing protein [Campylobacteraceae bacterium]